MNTFKKTGGFTLVELIIVIAILAILSSVAVAGYSSYIKKANDSAVETFLNDLKTHVALANAKGGAVSTITVSDRGLVTVVFENAASDFKTSFEEAYNGESNVAQDQNDTKKYTFNVTLPTNWDNSKYDGKTASWSNNSWSAT